MALSLDPWIQSPTQAACHWHHGQLTTKLHMHGHVGVSVCKVGVSSRFFVQRGDGAFSRYSNVWPAGDRRIETELKRSIKQRAGVCQLPTMGLRMEAHAYCVCISLCMAMGHQFLITLKHRLWILRCWDCATTTSALLRGHCSNHLFRLRQGRQRDQRGSHDEGVRHGGHLHFCQSVHFTIASIASMRSS